MMIKKLCENINTKTELRQSLIAIKAALKEEENKKEFLNYFQEHTESVVSLLKDEDAKVRKNTALILGLVEDKNMLKYLYEAYENELQMFVKGTYVLAMSHYDCTDYLSAFKTRLQTLAAQEVVENNKKHIQEEMGALQSIVLALDTPKKHTFSGWNQELDLIFITNRELREVVQGQMKDYANVSLFSSGVRVHTKNLKSLVSIRTYREILFPLKGIKDLDGDPAEIAQSILKSNLLILLKECHEEKGPFYFRVGVASKLSLEQRSIFAKKLAGELELQSKRTLINSTSNYEIEIRLSEMKTGTWFPSLKLYTIEDNRFSYRKNVLSTSIHPTAAALICQLAKPYLKEDGQILDPFCGVGTMLLERNKIVVAKEIYGIDLFEEAIEKARENTEIDGTIVHYINRNFFDFTHDYIFDEIITNMPVRRKGDCGETDALYQRFFVKAEELLTKKGIIIMYSNEMGYVKKQLRLKKEFALENEYCINPKEDFYLFIIRYKGVVLDGE